MYDSRCSSWGGFHFCIHSTRRGIQTKNKYKIPFKFNFPADTKRKLDITAWDYV